MIVVSVVANQDVAVQNWWHFFSQPSQPMYTALASYLFLTTKLSAVRL